MTEAFLLGTWLGGALCYGAVLSTGPKPMPLLETLHLASVWPLALALVFAGHKGGEQ